MRNHHLHVIVDMVLRISSEDLQDLDGAHLGVLVVRVVKLSIFVGGLELNPDASLHMLYGKEADVLVQLTSDTLEGVQDIGEVGMDGQGDLIAHGVFNHLGDTIQSIRRILGKSRAES